MVGNRSRPMATGYTCILLFGLFLYASYLSLPNYNVMARLQPFDPFSHNMVLSAENPVFHYDMPSSFDRIEIVYLSTNSTPISLHILDGTGTLFNATNVTFLSGLSLTIERTGFGTFWLEIARQHSDATLNITMRGWSLLAPVVFDLIVISPLVPIIAILVSLYSLYRVASITRYKTRRGPVAIIILLIIGAALTTPLMRGTWSHDFEPTYTLQASYKHYSISLNESYPSSSSDLIELSPEGTSWVLFQVHNFNASTYPFLIRVTNESEQNMTIENVSSGGLWWLSFDESVNRSTTLAFERIDADIELQFAIEASYRILVEGDDPFIPTMLALLGASFSILAIGLAVFLDWRYYKRSPRETPPSSVPV